MTNSYPRESVQFQPVIITNGDVPVLSGIQFSDVTDGSRPLTWKAPVTLSGQIGVMVSGYPAGRRQIYAQIVANPETPVIYCGTYLVT